VNTPGVVVELQSGDENVAVIVHRALKERLVDRSLAGPLPTRNDDVALILDPPIAVGPQKELAQLLLGLRVDPAEFGQH